MPRIPLLVAVSALIGASACSSSGGTDAGGGTDSGSPGNDAGGQDSGTPPADGGGGGDAGLVLRAFPPTSIIYQDISDAGIDPNSLAIINTLVDAGGWGTAQFQIDFSLTVLYADNSVPRRTFTTNGVSTPDCDLAPFPVPPVGNVEGSTNYLCPGGDCHLLVYQGTRLYEMYNASTADGTATGSPFTTDCEVVWDLTHDYWQPGTPYSRGDQCTSADGAGMPVAALVATAAEIQSGVISHALRFTLPNPRIRNGVYLHPGTHGTRSTTGGPLSPAYVSRFRLRGNFDLNTLPNAAARTVAKALQTYGMFLDDGGNVPLTLDQSAATVLGPHDLQSLKVTDFEVIPSPDPPVALTLVCNRTWLTQ